MRVKIDEIKEGGIDRAWEIPSGQLDEILAGDCAGYRASAPARVVAHLDRFSLRVLVAGRSRADVAAPCGRCLQATGLEVPVDFKVTLVPEEKPRDKPKDKDRSRARTKDRPADEDDPQAGHGGSFAETSADEDTYAGKEIDLDLLLREQILLALPGYPLCSDECKGLCPACGQNLNERECGCDRRVPDPRWAGLEKFRGNR